VVAATRIVFWVALVAAAGLLSPAAGGLVGGVSLVSALVLIGEVRYQAVRTLGPLGATKEVAE